jgi:hypothetical protein
MWYNGTELSTKARRAIENEKITIVSHITGCIHTLFKEATINKQAYEDFQKSLKSFLKTDFNFEVFTNFLRTKNEFWSIFQYRHTYNNKTRYVDIRTIFSYEHSSKNKFASDSRKALFDEIDHCDFYSTQRDRMIVINDFEKFLNANSELTFEQKRQYFIDNVAQEYRPQIENLLEQLRNFICTEPRLPDENEKEYIETAKLLINTEDSREDIIKHIFEMADTNEFANLAIFAYRQMENISWIPFTKAAIERNPVSTEALKNNTIEEAYKILSDLKDESIYSENRLAQPDEVWNFGLGDGLEKAFTLVNHIYNTDKSKNISICANMECVNVTYNNDTYTFTTQKHYKKAIHINGKIITEEL